MRRIPIKELKPNYHLALNVMDASFHVILKKGDVLSEDNIKLLQQKKINCVYIIDLYSQNLAVNSMSISQNILQRIVALTDIGRAVSEGRGTAEVLLKAFHAVNDIVYSTYLDKQNTKLVYEANKFLNYNDIETSIYVAITTSLFALKLGWNPDDTIDLCLAVLLRDIGVISPILNQDTTDVYFQHTILGADYLRTSYNLPEVISQVIEQHHECFDGTGFPKHLKGNEICSGARILQVVDFYYQLQSEVWKTPSEIQTLIKRLNGPVPSLDPVYLSLFLHNVEIFTVDMLLELECGDICIVVGNNADDPLCPQVKILKTDNVSHAGKIIRVASQPEFNIKSIAYYVD